MAISSWSLLATAEQAGVSSSALQVTVPQAVPAGRALVVAAAGFRQISAVTDSRGNSWLVGPNPADNTRAGGVAYCPLVATALQPGDTITVNWGGLAANGCVAVYTADYSGVFQLAAEASAATAGVASDQVAAGPTGPVQEPDGMMLVVVGRDGSSDVALTHGVGGMVDGAKVDTSAGQSRTLHVAWRQLGDDASGQSYTGTLTVARQWACAVAVFTASVPPVRQAGSAEQAGVASTTLVVTVPAPGIDQGRTVLVAATSSRPAVSVTDSRGNSYTVAATANDRTTAAVSVAVCRRTAAALQPGDTITVTWSASTNNGAATVYDVGVGDPDAVVVDRVAGGASPGANSAAVATGATPPLTAANDVYLVAVGRDGDPGVTLTHTTPGLTDGAKVSTSAGTARSLHTAWRMLGSDTAGQSYQGTLSAARRWAAALCVLRTQPAQAPPAAPLLVDPSQLPALPKTGPAWEHLLSWANMPLSLSAGVIGDQDDQRAIQILAKALVGASGYSGSYTQDAKDACLTVASLPYGGDGRALGPSRNLAGYVIACDVCGQRAPAVLDFVAATLARVWSDGKSIVSTSRQRPNNWGTNALASTVAAHLFLGQGVADDAAVFRGWLGDRASYAAFKFGDMSWQADPENPVGINPPGATIVIDGQARDVDGVLPDDQRRTPFTWPPPHGNYVYGALQGATLTAELLTRAGYPAWQWQTSAIGRAYRWLHQVAGYPADGDNVCQVHLANARLGTSWPADQGCPPGKNIGFLDWLAPLFQPSSGAAARKSQMATLGVG